ILELHEAEQIDPRREGVLETTRQLGGREAPSRKPRRRHRVSAGENQVTTAAIVAAPFDGRAMAVVELAGADDGADTPWSSRPRLVFDVRARPPVATRRDRDVPEDVEARRGGVEIALNIDLELVTRLQFTCERVPLEVGGLPTSGPREVSP